MGKATVLLAGYFLLVISTTVTTAFGSDCGREFYFSASDANNEKPLRKPQSEFVRMRDAAEAGDAQAQRNLAVSYENGYLVTECAEKALYWYKKAAANGDGIAQSWMARYGQSEKQMQGSEYVRSEPSSTGVAAKTARAENEASMSQSEDSRQRYKAAELEYKKCFAQATVPLVGCRQLLGDPGSGCWQTYGEKRDDPDFTERGRKFAQERYDRCLDKKRAEQVFGK